MKSEVLFSVIIPTYNRADLIVKSINSVLCQNYSNFEIIVVDDGSTDNTEEVVKGIFSEKLFYYKKKNAERAAARNFGIEKAKGDYITFLDSDDILYKECLEEAHRMIHLTQKPEIFHLAYEIIQPDGKVLLKANNRKGNINRQLIKGNLLSCIGIFIKKEVAKENKFNEDIALSGSEDWELWMRLAARYPIFYSNKIVAAIINHNKRSVCNVDEDRLIKRLDLAADYLLNDSTFKQKFLKYKNEMFAHLRLYLSLHLALDKKKRRSFKFLLEAIKFSPSVIFTRKTAGVLIKMITA